ncbi:3'-5' exonuclease [Paenibacillus validus]|uniref:3'-5' exonuclease n=1 Tax=Paenibacillus validus TaxID=44253 RepID=UPI000FD71042|nr:3'-5' exonuclease [Paenibacillus validus]MED4600214.1 3'-5' exonuclease [Paenibacillus validus]MED4605215.1 3'-5' exonuclease [Paenibacillus validus]
MGKAVVAISSDFLTAFAVLPRQIQGKVTEFINKFRNNPQSPGINYERIKNASDNKICSVRIDDTYRGIVVRQEETGVYLLLWVDHHDDAYAWAQRKKCTINPTTGNVQVFDITMETPTGSIEEDHLFVGVSDKELLSLGVPKEQLPLVRSIVSEEMLFSLKQSFPEDAYESLEWLANGFTVEEVSQLFEDGSDETGKDNNFATALDHARSQKNFVIIEGEDELRRIMAEPLEKWRVFLHPTQKKIAKKDYSGPASVIGGAGTGKTVVAMHRAKYLASQIDGKGKILFTTYTTNLAGDIKENLRKICTVDELRRIEVINLDAWVMQFMRDQGFTYSIAYDEQLSGIWDEAIILAGDSSGLTSQFYMEEWTKVVSVQEAYTKETYMKASRIGRGTRLDRKLRIQVWSVIEEFQALMKDRQIRDLETAMYECRLMILKNPGVLQYSAVIVDEAQDLSINAFRLLRSIAGEQHKNDMFIVGDAHQRIYKNKVILSKCGINVRGRSSRLRINYRTTEEIRKYAFGLLRGVPFDDLDTDSDSGDSCRSLTHGIKPVVKSFNSALEELGFIIDEIKRLHSLGTDFKNICIVARTHKLLDDYISGLSAIGIRTYEIKRNKIDDRNIEGVRVATMHRVKGLEFKHVFVAAVNKRIVPLHTAIDTTDSVTEEESVTAEKCLLYVALTRAQETAYITSYGLQSELII